MKSQPLASVVIITRNRKNSVRICVESCWAQDYQPIEILVFDDASQDGTADFLQERYPQVRLFRNQERKDCIVLRNRGFQEARGEVVFSIDDDAYYTDPGTIRQAMNQFSEDPLIGALALPFIEPTVREEATPSHTESSVRQVRNYKGCAHAIRREVAIAAGGYREYFIHQGEERDLCIRLMNRGLSILRGTGSPIVHMVSPIRDQKRLDLCGVRSTLLFDYLNIPLPYVFVRIMADACRLFLYKLSLHTVLSRLGYVMLGICACVRYAGFRKAVSWKTYRRYRSLASHGPIAHSGEIPPPATPIN